MASGFYKPNSSVQIIQHIIETSSAAAVDGGARAGAVQEDDDAFLEEQLLRSLARSCPLK